MKNVILSALLLTFASCSSKHEGLRVAATAVPHAEMLEYIAPDLKEKGINLVLIITEDYNLPNRALSEKEVDANFFQHKPYLDAQVEQFDYKIESLASIEIEPMGIYSHRVKNLNELKPGSIVAIPNDPSNEARALQLLADQKLITLNGPALHNVVENPKNLSFIEVDAAMLPRTLSDVDAAVINTNYALLAGLSPLKDALAIESIDSPYANIIAIRIGDEQRPEIIALKEAMTSEKMRLFIKEKYRGAILPAF
jgi:D-methionine transport system substrate-binding protein